MKMAHKLALHSISGLVFLGLVTFCHAQKDYSRGFKKFYQLGLPDVKNSEYVKLSAYGAGLSLHGDLQYRVKVKGNAWLVEENKTNGWARFIVDQVRAIKVYDREKLMELRRKEAEESGSGAVVGPWDPSDPRISGTWEKVDLKDDVKVIIETLEEETDKASSRSWIEHSDASGRIFLLSAHLHGKGYTNEANRIVGKLFSSSEDPHRVIMKGLNILADGKYEEAYARFRKEKDWARFEKDLEALLARFTVGWEKAPAVKRVAEKVNTRLQQKEIPPLKGEGLSDTDKKLAHDLASAEKGMTGSYRSHQNLWILAEQEEENEKAEKGAVDLIISRGMKSIPLLLALLEDDYLTLIDRSSIRGGHSYYSSYHSRDGQLTEEQILSMYNNMNRPASRSDIAYSLLLPLRISGERYSSGNITKNELHSDMKLWHEENKDKSRLELAKLYLSEGDSQQQSMAIGFVLVNGKEEDMADVEKYFLNVDHPMMNAHMVQQYVMVRGKKAGDFVDKYEKQIRSSLDSKGDDPMYKSDKMQERIEKTIERLKKLVSAKPADETLASVLSGESSMDDVTVQLQQKLGQMDEHEALSMLLDATLKAEEGDLKNQLISMAASVPHLKMRSGVFGMHGRRREKVELEIEKHKEQWKKLLNDNSRIPSNGWEPSRTVAESTAQTMEGLYGKNRYHGYSTIQKLGEDAYGILVARGKARLEGKTDDELPEFPSADNISDKDRKALGQKILGATDPGEVIAGLSLDEKLALAEMCVESDEGEKLNAKLLPLTHTIAEVDPGKLGGADRFKAYKGKAMDTKIIKDLLKFARKMAGEERVVSCMLWRRPLIKGISLRVMEMDKDSDRYRNMTRYRSHDKDQSPKVTGSISAHRLHASAEWKVESEKSGEEEKEAPESETDELMSGMMDEFTDELDARQEEAREQFWEMAEKLCKGEDGNVCANASVYFMAIPSIEKEVEETTTKTEE